MELPLSSPTKGTINGSDRTIDAGPGPRSVDGEKVRRCDHGLPAGKGRRHHERVARGNPEVAEVAETSGRQRKRFSVGT